MLSQTVSKIAFFTSSFTIFLDVVFFYSTLLILSNILYYNMLATIVINATRRSSYHYYQGFTRAYHAAITWKVGLYSPPQKHNPTQGLFAGVFMGAFG